MHAAKQQVKRACAHRADVEFFIKAPGSEDVLGKITKTSAQGLNAIAAQMFTQADNFMAECTRAPQPWTSPCILGGAKARLAKSRSAGFVTSVLTMRARAHVVPPGATLDQKMVLLGGIIVSFLLELMGMRTFESTSHVVRVKGVVKHAALTPGSPV